ncbi:MAG: aminotransferase class I/II-fold pyridoxal phosphate-dependent enzyme, partial [Devosia sp.]
GEVDIWMGTLSKALASCGGYIAGKRDLVSYLRHTAPAFVFSVGLAPPLAGAALRALTLLAEEPERVETLRQRSALFHALAKEAGLDIGSADPRSAIVPIMAGEFLRAAAVARDLLNDGILALPIGFPAVARDATRLRFFLSASHTEEDIRLAIAALTRSLARNRGAAYAVS